MKIIAQGCLIAQMKRFDALITTQKKPQLSAKYHFGKKSNIIAQNDQSSKISIFFLRFFLIF
jgi:hypothetical protein